MLDPDNPNTEDNGMGDKNSVAIVADRKKETAPVIYADRLLSKTLSLRQSGRAAPLTRFQPYLKKDPDRAWSMPRSTETRSKSRCPRTRPDLSG